MQVAHDRQKSYTNLKRKPMEFQVGDKVMLKVSPWKGVVRFGKRGKLNSRYVGPLKVLEKIRSVVYKLELPQELSRVHNMFHVSNLKKCYAKEPLAVLFDGLHFDDKLQFVEEPAPPSPDYVPGPKYPPLLDFVLEPVYLEFMPLEDEILPAEEQPLPAAISPTADSPGYVPESDPEEDDDEDLEEDPADYPADGGDDGDDENESFDDDEDEDMILRRRGEEEHPAPADSTVVALPAVDQAPSAEETELFETDESAATPPPHPAYRVTARISIRDETPI
ncbi:hypothetical protein Tco_0027255 [Tanacetum coccineum]